MITRLLRAFGYSLAPVFVALYVGATTFSGASFAPWRPLMVDLDVYRLAGSTLLQGGDYYDLPGPLQFLYPPFAAVLAVPLALIPVAVAQIGWTTAGALALLAMLYRFGLKGWVLSLVGTACMFFVAPVVQTLAFGQLGIFLVALIVLDLAPGPRILPRRLLPEGALTAVAAAIKLTPAIFVVYLLLAGKRRAFVASMITGIAVTALAWVLTPSTSTAFWTRLAHGDTGLGHSIIYYTNQSVLADVVRLFGLGSGPSRAGLIASAVVALLGVWAAVLWHRIGDVRLAVTLCGVAGLLASPVSWQHHFVWVVPLALCLAERRTVRLPDPDARARLDLRRLGRRGTARADRRDPSAAERRRRRTHLGLDLARRRLVHGPGRDGPVDRRHRHRARSAAGRDRRLDGRRGSRPRRPRYHRGAAVAGR